MNQTELGTPLVQIDELTKVYEPLPPSMRFLLRTQVSDPVQALDGVSLSLKRGEVVVVVGPNGAGKSTLFRILTGLTTSSSGSAKIANLDVTADSAKVRRHIGFAPAEDRTLLLRHTCVENLQFHGAMQGMRGEGLRRSIADTLEYVGLVEVRERAAIALSSGMRARLQLARALLTEPDVLILDEPTSSIDPVAAREIIKLVLSAARQRGAAVLISSHRLEEIEELHERVLLLDRGKPIFSGELSQFRRQFGSPTMQVRFLDALSARSAKDRLKEAGVAVEDSESPVSLTLGDERSVVEVANLMRRFPNVVGISERAPSLLDVLERAWRHGT